MGFEEHGSNYCKGMEHESTSNYCKGNAVLQQTKGASVALVLKAIRQAAVAFLLLLLLVLLALLLPFALP